LRSAVSRLNGEPGRAASSEPGRAACSEPGRADCDGERRGTLEVFLTGRGVPDGLSLPDPGCDPSPGRLAVRISRHADTVARIHVLGREPSLSPIFLRAVYLARQAGVPRAVVRTDGLVFADPASLARAIKAGVTDIEMRVFGTDNKSWQRATGGRGDITTFMRAAALVGASSSVVNGRALVQLGTVLPDSIPAVRQMLASAGLRAVTFESPISCLPVKGLEAFVSGLERAAG
jgi:hypothetical protein